MGHCHIQCHTYVNAVFVIIKVKQKAAKLLSTTNHDLWKWRLLLSKSKL